MENTVIYTCPCCGAGLKFNPDKGNFSCEFCLSEFGKEEIEGNKEEEAKRKQKEEQDKAYEDSMQTFICPTCGAEVIADKDTVADFCYYCHNPILHKGRLSGSFRPDKIIPFKYGKEEAEKRFYDYIKKKKFIPKGMFEKEQLEKISGIYYPFWVTDSDATALVDMEGTRSRTFVSNRATYRETVHYQVERGGDIHFEDISNSALSGEEEEMIEGILPFPSDAHEDFSMAYTSGFFAKKRNIEKESLYEEVRDSMNKYSRRIMQNDASGDYDTIKVLSSHLNVKSSHWSYTLFPVWVLTYNTGKKRFTYALNGCTGKFYGSLPVDYKKLTLHSVLWGLGTLLLTTGVLILGGMLL